MAYLTLSLAAALSITPIPLVDCAKSVRTDREFSRAAVSGHIVTISAPRKCGTCGSTEGREEGMGRSLLTTFTGDVANMVVLHRVCTAAAHEDFGTRVIVGDGHQEHALMSTANTDLTYRLLRNLVCFMG